MRFAAAGRVLFAAGATAGLGVLVWACTIANDLTIPSGGGTDAAPTGDAAPTDATATDGSPTVDAADPFAAAILASAPLAYYPLDEAPGSPQARDVTGHHFDCDYVGAPGLGAKGVNGSSVAFTGAGAGAAIQCKPAFFDFKQADAFSFEGWFAPDVVAGNYFNIFTRVAPGGGGPKTGYEAFFSTAKNDAGVLLPYVSFAEVQTEGNTICTTQATVDCGNVVPDDGGSSSCGFQHIVVTLAAGQLTLYVNGGAVQSSACGGLTSSEVRSFLLGNYDLTSCGCGFVGRIDEFAVYTRALTAAEVQTHFRAAPSR
jgi:hypothetical protein